MSNKLTNNITTQRVDNLSLFQLTSQAASHQLCFNIVSCIKNVIACSFVDMFDRDHTVYTNAQ